MTTRRFFARPASLELLATGSSDPWPRTRRRSLLMPVRLRSQVATLAALACDSGWLIASLPESSV
jgi:hypothetical protein